ncbi:MAG: metal-dependent transcriptional regulator [Gaiellaceae bacterium]
MSAAEHSEAVQNYLRVIHKLQAQDGRASTTAIARALRVTAASATGMITKLAERDLVEHKPYRGVTLTETGERAALEVVRHHRLLERYLAETLEVPLSDVHSEADRLEHALSENLEAHIAASLGHPTHDPHGDPIPDADLNLAADEFRPLSLLSDGERATVRRVPDGDANVLEQLCAIGIVPGQVVELRASSPARRLVTLCIEGEEHQVSAELAQQIGVSQ